MFPGFQLVEYDTSPFQHLLGHCRRQDVREEWLGWLESDAPWQLATTDFYEQYEFNLLDARLASPIQALASPAALTSLREQVVPHFGESLSARVDVTAHKLIPGQTIRIHNDFIPSGETHRILLQLNRGWEPDDGGYLMLFGGPEVDTVAKLVEPQHGSVQAFAVSPRSYHAVSTVHRGERYTIVYSFRQGT